MLRTGINVAADMLCWLITHHNPVRFRNRPDHYRSQPPRRVIDGNRLYQTLRLFVRIPIGWLELCGIHGMGCSSTANCGHASAPVHALRHAMARGSVACRATPMPHATLIHQTGAVQCDDRIEVAPASHGDQSSPGRRPYAVAPLAQMPERSPHTDTSPLPIGQVGFEEVANYLRPTNLGTLLDVLA